MIGLRQSFMSYQCLGKEDYCEDITICPFANYPVCFIIPEYINRRIVENGTEEQKRKAWQNLILTEQLRGRRNIAGSMYSVFAVADKLYRTIFDAQNSEFLPGKLVRSEGGKSSSKGRRVGGGRTVAEAYDYSGDTYYFYKDVFDRNSIDSKGMRLDSTVHYGEDYKMHFGMELGWFTVMEMARSLIDSQSR